MHGGDDARCEGRRDERAAAFCHAKRLAEERLCRGRPETDEDLRPQNGELRIEPGTTGRDLGGVRLLVDALLSAGLPLEMLDGIGDVRDFPVDAGFLERLVEELSGGSDERASLQIFAVAGLLADEHEPRRAPTFAEDGLRAAPPQVA